MSRLKLRSSGQRVIFYLPQFLLQVDVLRLINIFDELIDTHSIKIVYHIAHGKEIIAQL